MTWILIIAIWGTPGMAITSVPGFHDEDECARAADAWKSKVTGASWDCAEQSKPQPARDLDVWAVDADPVFRSKVEAFWAERRKEQFELASKRAKVMSDVEFQNLLDSLDRRVKKIEAKKP